MTLNLHPPFVRFEAFVLTVGVTLALLGPFGQAERFLLAERIGLWIVYLAVGLPLFWAIRRGLLDRIAPQTGWLARAGKIGLAAVIGCVPMLGVVELIGLIEGRPLPQSPSDWVRSAAEVAILAAPILLLSELVQRSADPAPPSPVLSGGTNKAAGRQDDPARRLAGNHERDFGTVHAFCAEGHYTRIFGPHGDRLVDFNFSDIVEIAASWDGAQVHRSWWVARAAVRRSVRKGSAAEVILGGGLRAPVARRRRADLKRLGWPI